TQTKLAATLFDALPSGLFHCDFHRIRGMSSCGLCRRLFDQASSRAGNGGPARHDRLFPMHASWNFGGLNNWNHFVHPGSAASTCWILHCAGLALLIVCVVAGLLVGVPYVLSDKPSRIDGKRVELQFELRAPPAFQIPDQPNGYSIRVSLYTDNQQRRFAFIDWNGITKDANHITI